MLNIAVLGHHTQMTSVQHVIQYQNLRKPTTWQEPWVPGQPETRWDFVNQINNNLIFLTSNNLLLNIRISIIYCILSQAASAIQYKYIENQKKKLFETNLVSPAERVDVEVAWVAFSKWSWGHCVRIVRLLRYMSRFYTADSRISN